MKRVPRRMGIERQATSTNRTNAGASVPVAPRSERGHEGQDKEHKRSTYLECGRQIEAAQQRGREHHDRKAEYPAGTKRPPRSNVMGGMI